MSWLFRPSPLVVWRNRKRSGRVVAIVKLPGAAASGIFRGDAYDDLSAAFA